MNYRKRDDVESGYLYRVVCRPAGSDAEWEHTSYGHYGKPRTYMTLGSARGMKTRMERHNRKHLDRVAELEFSVQRSPVQNWEIVE